MGVASLYPSQLAVSCNHAAGRLQAQLSPSLAAAAPARRHATDPAAASSSLPLSKYLDDGIRVRGTGPGDRDRVRACPSDRVRAQRPGAAARAGSGLPIAGSESEYCGSESSACGSDSGPERLSTAASAAAAGPPRHPGPSAARRASLCHRGPAPPFP